MSANTWALALHGGAGTIMPDELTSELLQDYKTGLLEALRIGEQILTSGGSAVDAVEATVVSLENCYLFNAGRGAVFTNNGRHQMDAAIMDGKARKAGAVALLEGIANPIKAARAVMDYSNHVLLAGSGAQEFALQQGLVKMPDDYFYNEKRFQQWQAALSAGKVVLDHSHLPDNKKGTVGAVALDMKGYLAAATSTGGMTNKKFGRIGDSPLIGSGTWADTRVAVSCTGWGEVFILNQVANRIANLIELAGLSIEQACRKVIIEELGSEFPDSGGLIAVDALGIISMPYNSAGMYRARSSAGQKGGAFIFGEAI